MTFYINTCSVSSSGLYSHTGYHIKCCWFSLVHPRLVSSNVACWTRPHLRTRFSRHKPPFTVVLCGFLISSYDFPVGKQDCIAPATWLKNHHRRLLGLLDSGNQTWQVDIHHKWRQSENHLEIIGNCPASHSWLPVRVRKRVHYAMNKFATLGM